MKKKRIKDVKRIKTKRPSRKKQKSNMAAYRRVHFDY
jgi:hypothetical protein